MRTPASIVAALPDGIAVSACKLHPFGCSFVRATTDVMMMPSGNQKLLGWLFNHLVSVIGQTVGSPPELLPGTHLALSDGFAVLSVVLVFLLRPHNSFMAFAVAILMSAFVISAQMPMGLMWPPCELECLLSGGLLATAVQLYGANPDSARPWRYAA